MNPNLNYVPLKEAIDSGNTLASVYNGIEDLQTICHNLAKKSGWWDGVDVKDKNVLGTKIALMHSELSEALEGVRKGLNDSHLTDRSAEEVELADCIIRIFDYAGARNLDLTTAIIDKLAYNQQRADHTREHRAAEGGKKF